MTHTYLFVLPRRYAAFPHVVRVQGGRLVAVFREAGAATAERALTYTHSHQDLDSRVMLTASSDDGRTWSPARVIYESDTWGVNDPAVTVLRDGTLVVRFARWRLVPSAERDRLEGPVHRHLVREGYAGMTDGNGYVVSGDAGETWKALPAIVTDSHLVRATTREPVLELEDGTWLLPVYSGYPAEAESVWLLRSWDRGHIWRDASLIAGTPGRAGAYRAVDNFNETSIVDVGDSTILALIRRDSAFETDGRPFIAEGGVGELMWTQSRDVGLTWDPPRPADIWGQPGHLLRLASGELLCTYGHRRPPFGVRASLIRWSSSGWDVRRDIALREDGAGWDLGYPASVQLSGDEIFSVYYIHGPDGVRHIAGTRWRLSEMTDRSR